MVPDAGRRRFRPGDDGPRLDDLHAAQPRLRPLPGPALVRGLSRRAIPARYPVKAPKAARPRREGIAYWLEHDGNVLLVRRPAKGLLGGMLALPEAEPAPAEVARKRARSTMSSPISR